MIDLFAVLARLGRGDEDGELPPITPDEQVQFLREQECSIPICGFVLRRVFVGV